MGAETVEILRIVGKFPHFNQLQHTNAFVLTVRETLSADLIERLIVDILAIAESLTSENFFRVSLYPKLIRLSLLAHDGNLFAVVEASKLPKQPVHNDARPEKGNFGDGGLETEGKEQVGFSRQC